MIMDRNLPIMNNRNSKEQGQGRASIGSVSSALEVGIHTTDYDKVSVMPQRGISLQPRVAASATLGKESDLVLNRKAVTSAVCISL